MPRRPLSGSLRPHAVAASEILEQQCAIAEALQSVIVLLVAIFVRHLRLLGERVQRADLGAPFPHVEELAVAAENAGAEGLHLSPLPHHPELHSVPVHLREVPDLLVGLSVQGGFSHGLHHFAVHGVGQQGHVAQKLVAQVRLGRVLGVGRVPHVLCGVEGAEGQAVEEVARVQEARHGPHGPPRLALQHFVDLLQLGHPVGGEAELGQRGQELLARILRPEVF
mmetsp:Transcript_30915/g.86615  ORF Transcript_30915/g.86615 Transcript_30915/m.86615 type:complete len:224 (+) Transcript_30915:551-1222(+)